MARGDQLYQGHKFKDERAARIFHVTNIFIVLKQIQSPLRQG
jgi:hypothetical protein